MTVTLPLYRLDLGQPAPADLRGLFPGLVEKVRLEIGFGGGEHLRHEAARFPEQGFLGAEPFVNGIAKMAVALATEPRANLRLLGEDATLLLDWLPARSLSRVDLLYPDPWPKRRHWKRRFVSARNLDRIAKVLRPGGEFRFASDVPDYVNWTLLHLRGHQGFAWTARDAGDWRTPWEGWPGTRYEAKALREGRTPAYLVFRRNEG